MAEEEEATEGAGSPTLEREGAGSPTAPEFRVSGAESPEPRTDKLVFNDKSTTLVDGYKPLKKTAKEVKELDLQLGMRYSRLEMLERSLALAIQSFGLADEQVAAQWRVLVGEYNVIGMRCLQKGRLSDCADLLKRAMNLLHSSLGDRDVRLKLLAITYNNLSCFYKRKGLMKMALQHAEKARAIEEQAPEVDNPATTLLNLCAILSCLGRHREALAHAHKALEVWESGPRPPATPPAAVPDDATADGSAEPAEPVVKATISDEGRSSVLAICYHNMAIELEHLKEYEKARACHAEAVKVCEKEVGKAHPTYIKFKKCLVHVESKLKEQRDKQSRAGIGAFFEGGRPFGAKA